MAKPLQNALTMRFFVASCALLVGGCTARYRVEPVGSGQALVTARTEATAEPAPGPAIPIARGSYEFAMRFDIPRAQIVQWKIACPGNEQSGAVGESFETYQARRIEEIKRQIERDRERSRVVGNIVAGAVRGTARVGNVTVEAHADAHAANVEPPEPVIELSPYDTGRGVLAATVRVNSDSEGACSVSALADDASVRATFSITRIRDLKVEAVERQMIAERGAVELRTRVRANLIAAGADEAARQRRLEAEARARAEAEGERLLREAEAERVRREREAHEARLRGEREAHEASLRAEREERLRIERERRLEIEIRLRREREEREARLRWEAGASERARIALIERRRTQAFTYRSWYITWLVGECHADPHRRERLEGERLERERLIAIRLEAERQTQIRIRLERERRIALERAERDRIRLEHERRISLKLEAERAERERIRMEAERRAMEAERIRIQLAFETRTQMTGYLISLGAKLRPPRPEPRFEEPGAPPFDGARWIAGSWNWTGGQWIWTTGGWTDTDRFGATGGSTIAVQTVETVTVERPTVYVPPPTVYVPPPSGGVTIHVGAPPPPPTRTVIIRDRRDPPPRRVRDHRKDKADDEKQPTRVRDHRRR